MGQSIILEYDIINIFINYNTTAYIYNFFNFYC